MSNDITLYTFSISHFSEKIRWTLDFAHVPYREVRWTPFLHIAPALLKSRRATTVPIIEVGETVIQDSTRILHWLERNRAPFALIPEDRVVRDQVMEAEAMFDRIGSHVIRYAYATAFSQPDSILRLWTLDASQWQKRLLKMSFPMVTVMAKKAFNLSPDAVDRSEGLIEDAVRWLEDQVSESGYIVGDQLTAADITAAALLAPLACPDEHPVYCRDDYRDGMEPLRQKWRDSAGFEWVREIYRKHRRV